MKPEAALWAWFKKGLIRLGEPHHVKRVETPETGSGFPDVEGCISGACFNVELKVAHYIRKDGSFAIDHFTAEQAYFLHRRHEVGGRAFMLLRVGAEHHLFSGADAIDLHDARKAMTVDLVEARRLDVPRKALAEEFWRAVRGPIVR